MDSFPFSNDGAKDGEHEQRASHQQAACGKAAVQRPLLAEIGMRHGALLPFFVGVVFFAAEGDRFHEGYRYREKSG